MRVKKYERLYKKNEIHQVEAPSVVLAAEAELEGPGLSLTTLNKSN